MFDRQKIETELNIEKFNSYLSPIEVNRDGVFFVDTTEMKEPFL